MYRTALSSGQLVREPNRSILRLLTWNVDLFDQTRRVYQKEHLNEFKPQIVDYRYIDEIF
jgi:hypothetical protein